MRPSGFWRSRPEGGWSRIAAKRNVSILGPDVQLALCPAVQMIIYDEPERRMDGWSDWTPLSGGKQMTPDGHFKEPLEPLRYGPQASWAAELLRPLLLTPYRSSRGERKP
jgi:phosphopantothenoylcysteine synthetase/decarboxylase